MRRAAERHGLAFSLIEVLVALTVLSVGVVGVVGAIAMSVRTAGSDFRLDEATVVAEARMAETVHTAAAELADRSGTDGLFRWQVDLSRRQHALMVAVVTVRSQERGAWRQFELEQVFRGRGGS